MNNDCKQAIAYSSNTQLMHLIVGYRSMSLLLELQDTCLLMYGRTYANLYTFTVSKYCTYIQQSQS